MTEQSFTLNSDLHGLSLKILPHALRPVPKLSQEMFSAFMEGMGSRVVYLNGYGYLTTVALDGIREDPRTPLTLEPAPHSTPRENWELHAQQYCKTLCTSLYENDYHLMNVEELANNIAEYKQTSALSFSYTMQPLIGAVGALAQLIQFCSAQNINDADRLVMTALQGSAIASAEAGIALSKLVENVADNSDLKSAINAGNYEKIKTIPEGESFLEKFHAYLLEYGRGATTWFEAHQPTWSEEPEKGLKLIARYLDAGKNKAEESRKKSIANREQARTSLESHFQDNETLNQYKTLLEAAEDYVFVIEGRARWQVNSVGAFRVPCVALGKKMVEQQLLDEVNDIFFFETQEIVELTKKQNNQKMRELLKNRKADLESWAKLSPPSHLGEPAPPAPNPIMEMMFGAEIAQPEDPLMLQGVGANPGIVRGRARVLKSLDEADNFEAGEIIVCQFTSPPWMPLFPMAGAIITDQGGMLSHAAIEAREFGLPCVVGTQTATSRIPDKAVVEMDGLKGTVRIISVD